LMQKFQVWSLPRIQINKVRKLLFMEMSYYIE